MMYKVLWLLLLLGVVGCTAVAEEPATATLQGHVTIGPLQPVLREGETPPPVPPEVYAARSLDIFTADGETLVTTVSFNSDGSYQVVLQPGHYRLVLGAASSIDHSPELPQTVELKAGETLNVDFSIDTGIR